MRNFTVWAGLLFSWLASTCLFVSGGGVTFNRDFAVAFRVSRGGDSKQESTNHPNQEYKRAQKAILQGISHVEHDIQKAVEQQVATLFHGIEDTDNSDKKKAKEHKAAQKQARKVVDKGVQKAKRHVDSHKMENDDGSYPFEIHNPYEWPHHENGQDGLLAKIADSRVLHAVEAAERAVVKAVQDEVDLFFHETTNHHDNDDDEKTKQAVKVGVESAKSKIQETHQSRRQYLLDAGELGLVEDYMRISME